MLKLGNKGSFMLM